MEKYLIEETPLYGGVQKIYKFPNGLGASVVSHQYSYGGKNGLWEVAVLGENGEIIYDTPITSDVIGNLEWDEVEEILKKISSL